MTTSAATRSAAVADRVAGRAHPWWACAAALCCLTAQAQEAAVAVRLEVETVPPDLPSLYGAAPRRDAVVQPAPAQSNDGLRVRWWWEHGRFELGGGADYWRTPTAGPATALTGTPVLGLRATLSPQARLVYELMPGGAVVDAPFNAAASLAQPRSQFALEFKAKSNSERRALPPGFLRVQLQGESSLQCRPRGGGLNVTYRSRF